MSDGRRKMTPMLLLLISTVAALRIAPSLHGAGVHLRARVAIPSIAMMSADEEDLTQFYVLTD